VRLHSQVTREVLVQLAPKSVPPGHPADTMRRENQALRGAVEKLRKAMAAIQELADEWRPGMRCWPGGWPRTS